jgi:phage-related protein
MGIFSFFEDAINEIVSSILSQFNFIQDLITAPIRAMVSQVLSGVWKGDGANRFANEMTQEVIPMLASILTGGQNFAGSIKKSQNHMLQGFQQATNMAQGLFDVFNGIF